MFASSFLPPPGIAVDRTMSFGVCDDCGACAARIVPCRVLARFRPFPHLSLPLKSPAPLIEELESCGSSGAALG